MKILFSLLAFCLFASCVHSQEAVDTEGHRDRYIDSLFRVDGPVLVTSKSVWIRH